MIAVCYTCICVYRKPQIWQIVHNRLIICYIKLNQSLFQTKLYLQLTTKSVINGNILEINEWGDYKSSV